MVNRILTTQYNNSFFLFGARGTGKTTWLKQEFLQVLNRKSWYIDLLDADQQELYQKNPNQLKLAVDKLDKETWVVIDEIQKVPALLNVVHQCIQERGTRFVLTGSSARKLKRGAADMLAGRAFLNYIFPFTHQELGGDFDLNHVLTWGSLPQMTNTPDDQDKIRFLKAYTRAYIQEEIVAEQVVRKLEPFRSFLEIAAQQNAEIVNYSSLGRDVGVDTVTAQSYFQILEDTLIGFQLPAFHRSVRKRQRQNPKFYYFDIGVARSLSSTIHQPIAENTYAYGKLFEQFVILEAYRLNSYYERDYRFSYLRTKDNAEIDLIVERPGMPLAIVEIKSSKLIDERDATTLTAFAKDMGPAQGFLLSRDPVPKMISGVQALPWQMGLAEIGLVK